MELSAPSFTLDYPYGGVTVARLSIGVFSPCRSNGGGMSVLIYDRTGVICWERIEKCKAQE